ncbi:hypothetical protein Ahia01_000496800 [Argonauta hians]
MSSKFRFPVLRVDEILANLDFVKRVDYEKPESLRWFRIFSIMFEGITGVKLESLEEKAHLTFMKILDVDNPDLFEDSGHIIWFCRAMHRAFVSCGISDFYYKDVKDPTPKRLLVLSSAYINFLRFKSSREIFVQDVMDKVKSNRMREKELIDRNNELKHRLDTALEQKKLKEPEMEQLKKCIEDLKKGEDDVHQKCNDLLAGITERREKMAQLKSDKSARNCEIVKKKQEVERLQQNVVQSPEELRERMESLREAVEKVKANVDSKTATMADYTEQLTSIKTFLSVTEPACRMLVSMDDEQQEQQTVKEAIKVILEHISESNMKTKRYQRQMNEMNEAKADVQERLDKHQTQNRVRETDFDARHCGLVEQKKSQRSELEKVLNVKQELLNQKQRMVDMLEETEANTSTTVASVIKAYTTILEEVDKYHLFLKKNMNAVES